MMFVFQLHNRGILLNIRFTLDNEGTLVDNDAFDALVLQLIQVNSNSTKKNLFNYQKPYDLTINNSKAETISIKLMY